MFPGSRPGPLGNSVPSHARILQPFPSNSLFVSNHETTLIHLRDGDAFPLR